MSTKLFMIILALFALFVGYGYLRGGKLTNRSVRQQTVAQKNPLQRQLGAVEIEASVTELTAGQEGVISLKLNTHSVELDFDFTKISKVRDDLENEYPITEWTGGSGGHHLQGDLKFGPIEVKASKIILTVSEIEGEEAEFEFILIGAEQ